ncbi:MAG: glutamate--cysteine ligase, partial [Gammaproteobacteria bacterium]|nr:glutamate--cysteine ligase [Gammaproteobacteria bacterium]
MYNHAERRLKRLLDSTELNVLEGRQIGVEKESLRVTPDGSISQKAHPISLGSALTHPHITTDYSESLIEFITPPFDHIENVLEFLRDTQTFVYSKLEDEILWATSMPCVVAGDESIPLAQYGYSNAGMMKTAYRRGLGHRYGRVMQVIAGVHFNYSFPDRFWRLYQDIEENKQPLQEFISDSYFAMIRNLQRYGWMVPYLFGASPAVCKSFLGGRESSLHEFDQYTYYEPYATSLRMGDIGYQNNKENEIGVKACYRNLDAYVKTLTQAIETPYAGYEKFGLKVGDEYQQLNTNILQIENEYYSTVRPKQILQGNEKPALALKRRGVRYVELRSLDVNAYEPLGINETQLRFLEAFMVFCLIQDSPQICSMERDEIDSNEIEVAHRGRDPSLRLHRDGNECKLKDWALDVCEVMQGICELLDKSHEGTPYMQALRDQVEKIKEPELTPSATMLREMREQGEGFYHFARRMSQQH